ncbi:MAG: hypothetical protein SCALA701_04850 [Candidatus Scalindua sp.]|nr:MAG: hypothetical protein SCALA701_04850 [Candidatus Scalindua sp.]
MNSTIYKNYLYVAERFFPTTGIRIYDIKDIKNIQDVNYIPLGENPYHLDVVNGHLFVVDEVWPGTGSHIYSYSLSDPENPELEDVMDCSNSGGRAFEITKGFCIVASRNGKAVDVSNPSSMKTFGEFTDQGGTLYNMPYDVAFHKDLILIGGDEHVLVVKKDSTRPADSDGDGIQDSLDAFPTDPREWVDTDMDEIGNNADPDDDPDDDNDGLLDRDELKYKTNPRSKDTDGDGMPDGLEIEFGLDPRKDDSQGDKDGDGITNLQEYKDGTDPTVMDIVHVDFDYIGTKKGTVHKPFNTVEEAKEKVAVGGEIIIKAGTTDETPAIEKEVIIDTSGGEAVIGKQ